MRRRRTFARRYGFLNRKKVYSVQFVAVRHKVEVLLNLESSLRRGCVRTHSKLGRIHMRVCLPCGRIQGPRLWLESWRSRCRASAAPSALGGTCSRASIRQEAHTCKTMRRTLQQRCMLKKRAAHSIATRRPPGFSSRNLRVVRKQKGGKGWSCLRLSEGDGTIFSVKGRFHVEGGVKGFRLQALDLQYVSDTILMQVRRRKP